MLTSKDLFSQQPKKHSPGDEPLGRPPGHIDHLPKRFTSERRQPKLRRRQHWQQRLNQRRQTRRNQQAPSWRQAEEWYPS
jgi:hypothetical protein